MKSSIKPPVAPSPMRYAAEFDANAMRARLANERGPVFWRSLEELADSEGFRQWMREEFPRLAGAMPLDRRGFLKFIGASLALAGLSACSHPPQDEIVPYVHGQPNQVDGLPQFYATVLTRDGYARGVLVEDHQGRPTKVEGNPQHPASLGATDIFAQASVLQLWDPDRLQAVMHRGDVATWDDFAQALLQSTARFDANQGAGLRILTGTVTSPTLAAQLSALQKKYPRARWHVHQPCGSDNAREGARLAFGGVPYATRYRFERAKVILALDADFLADPAAGVRYARDFISSRDVDGKRGAMSRLYAIEPTPTLTGGQADHRLPLESAGIENFARELAARFGIASGPDASSTNASPSPQLARWLDALVKDLQANRGASLIVAGAAQPPEVHALAHAINAALGNVGNTLEYSAPVEVLPPQAGSNQPNDDGTLTTLVAAMRAGSVDTLLVLGANPVYDAPADLGFADALKRVPQLLHLGLYGDETGELAQWHLPQAHELEAWSDARAFDGTASIAQPLVAPLYDGKSAHELLAMLLGDELSDGRALVRRQWQSQLPDDAAWAAALQAGVVTDTALPALTPTFVAATAPHPAFGHPLPASGERKQAEHPVEKTLSPLAGRGQTSAQRLAGEGVRSATGEKNDHKLELLFRPDPTIGDGFWANNGWLQELPKPLTQLTWDNAAMISPALATKYKLTNGDMVELRSRGRSLKTAVWILPGQAQRSVTLHLGYGRRRAGRVGDGQGFDAYALRTSDAPWAADDLQIHPTGERYELAPTQHHFQMEGRDLLRAGTLAEYLADPRFAVAQDRYPDPPPSMYAPYQPGEYSWGMSIDLNACIGCKACTIACQAENNIPVVGKDQVQRGREMHWIRVDRYYEGEPENPRTLNQPVPCMMCEHAPCELVCPVGATVHDDEGLNVQVYNRCVGTRFCSNNCPYKVRRFNFLQYADKETDTLKAQRNPGVTVRRRGIMEKCTYCIQRIETAHIEADKDSRRIRDGEVLTACQAVCPTQAIRFGDMADAVTDVSRAKTSPRNYVMLGELNTRPHTSYLARLRNPNPELEDIEEALNKSIRDLPEHADSGACPDSASPIQTQEEAFESRAARTCAAGTSTEVPNA